MDWFFIRLFDEHLLKHKKAETRPLLALIGQNNLQMFCQINFVFKF